MLNSKSSVKFQTFSLKHKEFCWSGIGIRSTDAADPTMPPHRHSFFQVVFVADGVAVHEFGTRIFQATAGSIFFVSPFVVHRLKFNPDTECYVLYFDAQFLQQGFGVSEVVAQDSQFCQLPELAPFVYQPHCSYQLGAEEIAYVRARCVRIEQACTSRGFFDAVEARTELIQILTCVGKKYLEFFRSIGHAGVEDHLLDQRAREAIAFLKRNFRRELQLDEVAREVHLTGNYLTLLLKRETGKSFKKLLDELRLEHSKSLLAYTDTPIKRIAIESGFPSQAHFARRFKSFTSTTPGHFRRTHHAPIAQ
jgi:AraC-like DNA-binding protein/mannose-6-phosphate isomerase-like protein (cupin superfamily)